MSGCTTRLQQREASFVQHRYSCLICGQSFVECVRQYAWFGGLLWNTWRPPRAMCVKCAIDLIKFRGDIETA